MKTGRTGAEIRQEFIDFFIKKEHTFVPSSSLVPGGDQTLLFTNAGMVQFKDVFLGTDIRPYHRAVNSQKCMRVAGKHNDLEDVGRDDTHHTFFEMLGNWSFGDYYKKEAITWAWELLTKVWEIDPKLLWTTYFKDEKGEIPTDEEAAENWQAQPGIILEHVITGKRKDNFWEMADTGPCGPCSEIHIDLGPDACDKKGIAGHVCEVNGDCKRFLELWNLVFIQYNRLGPSTLEPLPARHVDTGMGFDRIVSILQGVSSNYKTDLFSPLIEKTRELAGQSEEEKDKLFTPYRVCADHARAATFLIADGVVPGNTGRNYVCRMIIRRAARFGGKIGLNEPFLAKLAEIVIRDYGQAYPELKKNEATILKNITREEERFQRTVESGMSFLNDLIKDLKAGTQKTLDGKVAFELYATHGLPLEITRDILQEVGLSVDEKGFHEAMDEHRLASGAGKAFGPMGGEDVDIYRTIIDDLRAAGSIGLKGVEYDPYNSVEVKNKIAAIVLDGSAVDSVKAGDQVEIILPKTCFYVESGGQVSDTGMITSDPIGKWAIRINDVRKPAAGVIVHIGEVQLGNPKTGDKAIARVDQNRRNDIRRNHTATHLLHAALHQVLGDHARQAGSLVAPDRLRFDFTHPETLTEEQLSQIEKIVNRDIQCDYPVNKVEKSLAQATSEGAMALFGEKYGEIVRTISIGNNSNISYELCGGTHVDRTSEIGIFLITSEGSTAAGIRRIEAVTSRGAFELVQKRFGIIKATANAMSCAIEDIPEKVETITSDLSITQRQIDALRQELVAVEFTKKLETVSNIAGIPVLAAKLDNASVDNLRSMTDVFRQHYPSGIVCLGTSINKRPFLVAAVTDDLVKKGFSAGDLVKEAALLMGGSGGGRPNLAQAGGKDPQKLDEALDHIAQWVKNKTKSK